MLGPAFVASVAYVDPGNFATNIQAGAQYGYVLLWVVLAANLMAMIVQYLSAKLGIVTDRSLPELVRERSGRPVTWGMWLQAEVVAMATDIAEFLGAALGLNLLFGVAMLPSGLITGVIPFALVPLVILTSRRDIMGSHVNQRRTTIAGCACAAVITALNVLLLCQQFFGR